jgi:predicted nucleotidyltransferase|tara:strand:- start:804 stop:1421 length:618 start_codon:yes stop_codon:yes gene_type:complete
MISNKKIELLGAWKNNIFSEFTISEIMKISKKNTKTWVFNALKLLASKKLLNQKRKGNLDIYNLNLNNPLLIQILQYIEAQNSLDFPQIEVIIEIIKKIPVKNYCLMVFGSYAENKETKNSDLDICFLIENEGTEKKIKPYFNEAKLNCAISIDVHYITFSDFIKMLLAEEENLGKQVFRKHIVFYNADIYYQLIKEAYKNGFRP